jgi:hypothetical protein
VKPEHKSNSVSKNFVGSSMGTKAPLNNNLVGPPPNLLNKAVMGGGKPTAFDNSKYESVPNRYHSSNQGVMKQR